MASQSGRSCLSPGKRKGSFSFMSKRSRWLFFGTVFFVSLTLAERVFTLAGGQAGSSAAGAGAAFSCDMQQYKAATGLTATLQGGGLTVQWAGSDGAEVRAQYAIDAGQPTVRELAVRKTGSTWGTLGQNLKPEYRVVSG